MPSQSDEKKSVIVAILDCLRFFNPGIGSYQKSVYTEDFDYSVKLTNGRIRLPENFVHDFEKSALSTNDEAYGTLAKGFIPNELPLEIEVFTETIAAPQNLEKEHKKPITNYWIAVLALALIAMAGLYLHSSSQKEREATIMREVLEKEHQKAAARDSLRKEQERIRKEREREIARINIYSQVSEEQNSYHVAWLFGGITDLKITVTNNSDYTLDMVKVKVSYIKASGGLYKEEYVSFNKIEPHSSVTEAAPDSDRGTSVTIERTALVCSELALY